MKNLILLVVMIVMTGHIFNGQNKEVREPSSNKVDCTFNKYVNKISVCPNYEVDKLIK